MDDIAVAETAPLNVSIEYLNNGEKLGIQVVNFSGATLTLIKHDALVEAAGDGAVLEGVCLLADGRTYDGLKFRINQCAQAPGMISAYAVDDRTKAALWEEAYYSAKGPPRMRAFNNKVPPLVPQRGHHTEAARIERLDFIRDQTGAALEKIAHTSLEADRLSGNLESFIGSVEIPIGAAGPLIINGEHAQGIFYAPIATTEGALVASISRGAWALSHSGGATAQVFRQRMMRVPYFVVGDMHQAMFFATWVTEHFAEIKAKTQEFSNHADLVELDPQIQGSRIHVHFVYETGDAAGQNMTTTCTWKTCLWILEKMEAFRHIDIQNFIVEANLSNDKKVTYQSFINGRGIHAQAEVFLPNRVIKRVLKVEPTQLFQGYKGLMQGGLQAGMVGFNVNVANLIAGIFTATGQDIASVHECSIAHLNMEQNDEGIYASISLPSLIIGTIGGGTALPHQRDCLSMLDCAGSGKSRKLAEIIASFALALDLSTASALAGGQFAVSHERLGRNKPVNYLTPDELTPDFFNTLINHGTAKTSKVIAAEPIVDLALGSSIITELSRKGQEKFIGHYPFKLTLQNDDGETSLDVMIKSKPTDVEVINMVGKLAMLGSSDLLEAYQRQNGLIDFKSCHTRELTLSTLDVPALSAVMPDVHGTYQDASREVFITATELLRDMELMDTADDVSDWTSNHINQVLDEIAPVHAHWLGKESELKALGLFDNAPSAKQMIGASDLWREMAQQAHDEFPSWVSADHLARYQHMIENLPRWWGGMETLPVTLIHNDFNPRNLAFKVRDGQRKLCVYDWELATISLPQHDVAEFLTFTLRHDCTLATVQEYAERHRQSLETLSGHILDAEDWWRGFHWSLQDYAVNRVLAYTMAHNAKHYGFMERVFATTMHMLELVEETTR